MSDEANHDGEANDLIPLMLGATRMLDALVEAAEARASAADPPAADDPLVAAALGLVSLRRSLRRWRLHAIHDYQAAARDQPTPRDQLGDAVSLR